MIQSFTAQSIMKRRNSSFQHVLLQQLPLQRSTMSFCSKTHILCGSAFQQSDAGMKAFKKRREKEKVEAITAEGSFPSSLDTILSHAGIQSSSSSSLNEALCPPLHLETTYTRPPSGDYHNAEEGGKGRIYARMGNPTRQILEDVMSSLELTSSNKINMDTDNVHNNHNDNESNTPRHSSGSVQNISSAVSCAFSSGMAAISSIIFALSSQPLHILLPDDLYHGLPTQMKTIFIDRGVTYSSIDMTNMQQIQNEVIEAHSHHSRDCNILIWMESPSNPLCKVTDIQKVCDWVETYRITQCAPEEHDGHGRTRSIYTAVDSTWAPPCITQPLRLGADVVIHSGTKYLAGHSDVLIGTATTSPYTTQGQYLGQTIRSLHSSLGATASPFDCWLTLRGLRTLHIRLQRQCQSAMEIATFLSHHPLVTKVHYPGLKSHPQHDIASKQMNCGLFGGMLSFELCNEDQAMAVAGSVAVIKRATSLGGTETLIEHRSSIEPEDGKVSPPGLLRMSVGLEDVHELKRDLGIALEISAGIN